MAVLGCQRPQAPTPAPAGPPRVVSLAPNLTEIVFAIGAGDLLVGRTSACDYPPEAAAVPVIGGFGEPSIERLLTVKPTLILDAALSDESVGAKISKLGLHRVRVTCTRLDDIPGAIETVGRLVQRPEKATALAAALRGQIRELRRSVAAGVDKPKVLVEIWNDPLTTAGRNSFLSDLVTLAGGRNLGDEVDKDYFQASAEWAVSRNPDVILCFYMTDQHGSAHQAVLKRSGWEQVAAVRSGRVYSGFDNNVTLRPGPRVLEGVDALRRCLAPPPAP